MDDFFMTSRSENVDICNCSRGVNRDINTFHTKIPQAISQQQCKRNCTNYAFEGVFAAKSQPKCCTFFCILAKECTKNNIYKYILMQQLKFIYKM